LFQFNLNKERRLCYYVQQRTKNIVERKSEEWIDYWDRKKKILSISGKI